MSCIINQQDHMTSLRNQPLSLSPDILTETMWDIALYSHTHYVVKHQLISIFKELDGRNMTLTLIERCPM